MKTSDLRYRAKLAWTNLKRGIERAYTSRESVHSKITPFAGSSPPFGKRETIDFICGTLPDRNIKILDVGPGRGVYNTLLKQAGYHHIDAVEKYRPYIEKFNLPAIYDTVFNEDIVKFRYDHYDLIIFGDVLEHLKVKDARRVIRYAQAHSRLVVVAVPYRDYQIGQQLDGSGDHRQYDLTRDLFLERYEGFDVLIDNEKTGVFHSQNPARAAFAVIAGND